MEKQEITFIKYQDKKHSIRYQARLGGQAINDIYVSRAFLGSNPPERLVMTLEEAE